MSEPGAPLFHHRHNPDGTVDSICLACYRTVASSPDEALLSAQERSHACLEDDVYSASARDSKRARVVSIKENRPS